MNTRAAATATKRATRTSIITSTMSTAPAAAMIIITDPKRELKALMKYMVGHNASHANELAQLAAKLKDLGEDTAYEQIMLAVSDFEKGNMRLSSVLAAME